VRASYRRRRNLRLPLLVLALPAGAISVVYLATSDVPLSDAGVTRAPVSVSTTVAAAPATTSADATSGYDAVLSATLTGQGLPVVGQTILFATGDQTCSASTDASGSASCAVQNLSLPPSSYSATFAGNAPFAPSSAVGSVSP
jgi:hypothetical protein